MKININNLIIEVTRRCNMQCKHCLRWDAENLDMNLDYVENIFKQISTIWSITFSWWEPSLVPDIIKWVLNLANKYNISIWNFYIATNWKFISDKFIKVCMDLYLYCYDKEYCLINLSNDIYHQEFDWWIDWEKLTMFKFAAKKNEKDNTDYWKWLIKEWRAYTIWYRQTTSSRFIIENYDDEIVINDWELYLNCNWELISWCDLSYENQSYHKICDSNEDFLEIIKKDFTN